MLGNNHPDVAASLYNLAMVYRALGGEANLQRAKIYFEQAYAIMFNQLRQKNPHTIMLKNNLEACLQELEDKQAKAPRPR